MKDRVREKICEILLHYFSEELSEAATLDIADEILSIEGLEIVDNEAELPEYPVFCCDHCEKNMKQAQQDMIKAGWRKVL